MQVFRKSLESICDELAIYAGVESTEEELDMVIAPLFCYVFFTTLMDSGLPKDLPAGVVDMDDSSTRE